MPKICPMPTDKDVELASKEYKKLMLSDKHKNSSRKPPSPYTAFAAVYCSRSQVDKWIKKVGGREEAIRILSIPDDRLKECYEAAVEATRKAIDLIARRIENGDIDNKDIISLAKMAKNLKELVEPTLPQTQVNIIQNIDGFLDQQ